MPGEAPMTRAGEKLYGDWDKPPRPPRREQPLWWWILVAAFTGMLIVSIWRGNW